MAGGRPCGVSCRGTDRGGRPILWFAGSRLSGHGKSSMTGSDAQDGGTPGPRDVGTRELSEAFAAHRGRLWRMVHVRLDRRLVGRVDPDDILQESFLEATRRLEHYHRQGI